MRRATRARRRFFVAAVALPSMVLALVTGVAGAQAPGVDLPPAPGSTAPAVPTPYGSVPPTPTTPPTVSPNAPGAQGQGVPGAPGTSVTAQAAGAGDRAPFGANSSGLCGGQNCAHDAPTEAYGLDTPFGFEWTQPLDSSLQFVCRFLWWITLLAFDAVMLVLEWAFKLDIVLQSMGDIKEGLRSIEAGLGGDQWLLLGVAAAGLWGLWNGLVRRRTVETYSGLAMTVGLMVLALYIMNSPDATVVKYSELANDSALATLSAVKQGSVSSPEGSYEEAVKGVWDGVIRKPWCVLQFGDAKACDPGGLGDQWLQHPANSQARIDLYDTLEGEQAQMQAPDGAFSRVGLLALILPGLLGALCLMLYIGSRLVLASIMALLLLLIVFVMLVVAAFGEAGRKAFITWLLRLAAAVFAKLIYALFLTVVLLVFGVIASMESLGFFATWLILIIFWWGVFLHREQLLSFASVDPPGRSGFGMAKAYFGYRAIRDIGGDLAKAPKAALSGARRGARVVRRANSRGAEARSQAADHRLRAKTGAKLQQQKETEKDAAHRRLEDAADDRNALQDKTRELGGVEREFAANRRAQEQESRRQKDLKAEQAGLRLQPNGAPHPRSAELRDKIRESEARSAQLKQAEGGLTGRESSLRAEQAQIRSRLNDPDLERARSVAGRDVVPSEREISDSIDRLGREDPRKMAPEDRRLHDLLRHSRGEVGLRERQHARWSGPLNTMDPKVREERGKVRRKDRQERRRRAVR